MIDYVFVIDTTRTMECAITESKHTMMELIEHAHKMLGTAEPPEEELKEGEEWAKDSQLDIDRTLYISNDDNEIIKFGVVAYRDHPGLDYDRVPSKKKPGTFLIRKQEAFEPSAFQYVTKV